MAYSFKLSTASTDKREKKEKKNRRSLLVFELILGSIGARVFRRERQEVASGQADELLAVVFGLYLLAARGNCRAFNEWFL